MIRRFFLILLSTIPFLVSAQKLQVTVFGGFSNYQGDLQDKRFTMSQAHPAFGAGFLYDITDKLSARANITLGKVSSDDGKSAKNAVRNLSFSSPVTDMHLGLEYSLFNLYERSFTPYIFAGISYFSFNPFAKDTMGNKVFLQPLSTEGQGFYQDRKKYSLNQFAIPFGGGVKFTLSENVRLAFEIGMRKTNTDYLDDVSTTYVDEFLLFVNRGQQAVDMSFRGDELKTGLNYPADGTQRGSAKSKDWYYFSGINLAIRLNGNGGSNTNKSRTGCPSNF